jgi:hypothetical protein
VDEEARDNLGGRLFAAAEALVPGSGPEFAGCVLDRPPEYGEELLRHPDALASDVREVALGLRLYPSVLERIGNEEQARRVTGMLLELDDEDVHALAHDPAALKARADEALGALLEWEHAWSPPADSRASGLRVGLESEGRPNLTQVDAGWLSAVNAGYWGAELPLELNERCRVAERVALFASGVADRAPGWPAGFEWPTGDEHLRGPEGLNEPRSVGLAALPSGRTRAGGGRRPRFASVGVPSAEEAVQFLITSSVAGTSHATYSSSMKHWTRFRYYRGRPVFFTNEPPAEVQDELILFVAFKGVVQGYAHGTVHVMLHALRFFHVLERLADPLADKPLLNVVTRGLKRVQGGPRRKLAATMGIVEGSVVGLNLAVWDDLVKITATMCMFVFLLRSREALRKGAAPDPEQCLRVGNLVMSAGGKVVTGVDVATADEAVLFMGKSKADQEGQGHVLNAYATDHWLCVVSLLALMHLQRPEHFENPKNYLFTLDDGKVLSRDVMMDLLRAGGRAAGVPDGALSVISLRAGGASALWEQGYGVEEIKRRGRWVSDAWRCYVWESRERWRRVAQDMLASKGCLMASLARFARA